MVECLVGYVEDPWPVCCVVCVGVWVCVCVCVCVCACVCVDSSALTGLLQGCGIARKEGLVLMHCTLDMQHAHPSKLKGFCTRLHRVCGPLAHALCRHLQAAFVAVAHRSCVPQRGR